MDSGLRRESDIPFTLDDESANPARLFFSGEQTMFDRPEFMIESVAENPNCKIFHTRMILTDYVSVGVSKCAEIADAVDGVLDFVMRLPGVTQAQVEAHKLIVVKSPVYDWEEIETPIIELLKFSRIPQLLRFPTPGLKERWLEETDAK